MIIKGKIYNTKPVTIRYSVKDYLDELNNRYGEYRAEREMLDTRLKKEQTRWENEIRRGWKDWAIRSQDEHNHNEILRAIQKEYAELGARAKNGFNEVISEADTRFERYNRATGDKVDLATVELLKSGVLSDREIKALAGDFKGNIAMLRIIGKYADERAKTTDNDNTRHELSALSCECKSAEFNYRAPLEGYVDMAVTALSENGTRSYAAHKVLTEEAYPEYGEQVKDMFVSADYEGSGNNE